VVPLNTPDGRPILLNMGNAIALDGEDGGALQA
jgi:hypothetical protein